MIWYLVDSLLKIIVEPASVYFEKTTDESLSNSIDNDFI